MTKRSSKERGLDWITPDVAGVKKSSMRVSYSVFVLWARRILPAVAAVLLLGVVVWSSMMGGVKNTFRLGAIESDDIQSEALRMKAPRFVGVDKDNNPFRITAKTAMQNREVPDVVYLQELQSHITDANGSWSSVISDKGIYDQVKQDLHLTKDVTVFQDEGYEFLTQSAHVDLNKNMIDGQDPVTGKGPTGTLAGSGFTVYDRGEKIILKGKSQLVYQPPQE